MVWLFVSQVMDELSDTHEQEKMDMTQSLIQVGRHSEVDEAVRELERRQHEQVESRQAEIDAELNTAECTLVQALHEEAEKTTIASHRKLLEEVRSNKQRNPLTHTKRLSQKSNESLVVTNCLGLYSTYVLM